MVSLSEAILDAKSHKGQTISPITLDGLQKALTVVHAKLASKKEELNELMVTRQGELAHYAKEFSSLQDLWGPLQERLSGLELEGDPLAMALEQGLALIEQQEEEQREREKEKDLDALQKQYQEYLAIELARFAIKQGTLPNYDRKEYQMTIKVGEQIARLHLVVSSKTVNLMEVLEGLKRSLREDGRAALIGELVYAARLYLSTYRQAFSAQLSQLAHLAALFYNDCQLLGLFLQEIPHVEGEGHVKQMGTAVLQDFLKKQLDELAEFCHPEMWDPPMGQLREADLLVIQRALKQATMHLGKIARLWKVILDQGLFVALIWELVSWLINWAWCGFLHLESINREAILSLPTTINSALLELPEEVLGSELASKVDRSLLNKFQALASISKMSIIQASNAFRRHDFDGLLTLEEFRNLVQILFPPGAMKSAFIAEINAEINF